MKIFLLICLLGIAQFSYAFYGNEITFDLNCGNPFYSCVRLHDEFYVGASFGYELYDVQQRVSSDIFVTQPKFRLSAPGFLGNAFAGYGRFFAWFYFAGEIGLAYSNAHTSYTLDGYHSKLHLRESISVSLLPGLRISPSTAFYVRLGAIRSYFTTAEDTLTLEDVHASYWGNGYFYGIGLQTAFAWRFSVREDFIHYVYGSFESPISTKSKASDNQFVMSVVYHFC